MLDSVVSFLSCSCRHCTVLRNYVYYNVHNRTKCRSNTTDTVQIRIQHNQRSYAPGRARSPLNDLPGSPPPLTILSLVASVFQSLPYWGLGGGDAKATTICSIDFSKVGAISTLSLPCSPWQESVLPVGEYGVHT